MKQRVGIIFGGKSAEHEVSLQSAKNIYEAIDKDKFDVVLLSISKQGQWQLNQADDFLVNADNPKTIALSHRGQDIAWAPGASHPLRCANSGEVLADLDVVFPIIHGTLGEDGSLQGFLRMLDIPFVGSGVLGSAASMDKDVTKRLLRDAGLKVAPFITVTAATLPTLSAAETVAQLGLPLFVKPANQGSSVGVSKVKNQDDLLDAIKEALRFDRKVLIETGIVGREIECAVLGNDDPQTSRCGEVVLNDDFYSYETKYISDQGAKVVIPAEIDSSIEQQIRETARQAYLALDCAGMSRVDVFLTPENEIIINEINTLPGFTNISMYPKLWQATGIAYRDLITQLIEFALERGAQDKLTASAFDH